MPLSLDARSKGAPLVWMFLLFALAVFGSHRSFLHLPYYWDEAGQFVPAARDIFSLGKWIPVSAIPNVHPPGVMAYLALAWKLAGYSPVTTRAAMLLVAALALFSAFLLARELWPKNGYAAHLAAVLLFASPLFFAQSVLAQLDLPAMLFTTLALVFFLRGRVGTSVYACLALVLVKETGLIVPMVLGTWLLCERRWRAAAWFSLPAVGLAAWIAILARHTGAWAGNPDFLYYNLVYPLNPFRVAVSVIRRLYFLLVADGHWIGALAILYGWKKSLCFQSRPWRIAATVVVAHLTMVVLLGGAGLERYLLPIMPILYAAMAVGLLAMPRTGGAVAGVLLVTSLAAANWLNPPYPFPYEDNLAFVDFVKLQQQAADFLARNYPEERIVTGWPLGLELSRPSLGFVSQPLRVAVLPRLAPDSLKQTDWRRTQVVVMFSQRWDPRWSLMHFAPVRAFWKQHYGGLAATRGEADAIVPFPRVAHFERRGQWVDIFAASAPGVRIADSKHR